MSNRPSREWMAAIAAHRFGLAEAQLSVVGNDPRGWLAAQLGPADAPTPVPGQSLLSGVQGLTAFAQFDREQARQRRAERREEGGPRGATPSAVPVAMPADMPVMAAPSMAPGGPAALANTLRQTEQADVRARMGSAATTQRAFAERLALFWFNHFTVSNVKQRVRTVAGAFEREAIRPHIAGRFETLLKAAVTHPAMLLYLDNHQSAGPNSNAAQRRGRVMATAAAAAGDGQAPRRLGLNENLAREVLELHTLGAAGARSGAYSQADVTAFAGVLTGWRAALPDPKEGEPASRFEPNWHEPGDKVVLGRRYPAGEQGLHRVLADLARHPATAQFIAIKLARHFVADEPPPSLVERLAQAFVRSDGDLPTVYRTLIDADEAWHTRPVKLKSPEEMVVTTARLLQLGAAVFDRQADAGVGALGQKVMGAPSPAGFPDQASEWLGPDAVWKRVEWATRLAERVGGRVDARALAHTSLGPMLQDETRRQIERAADGPQALALLLLSPEFQRR
jgi:uncharacterized protein (DUF1800 family)